MSFWRRGRGSIGDDARHDGGAPLAAGAPVRVRQRSPHPYCEVEGLPLTALADGAAARIVAVRGEGAVRHRLLALGVAPGAFVSMVRRAPFGDPLQILVDGAAVTLRAAEAADVRIADPQS